ncbi:hypothetical protein EON83_26020 [bacterium]|nr:MAG: hypothetical protein EON83_26020 [bacterium]
MAPFDLHPHLPSGVCPFCKGTALYTKITCDNCGTRLPWADGDADRMGGPCPNCRTFNVYARRACQKCTELLPWRDCMAAIYHSKHNPDKEFAWLAFSILGALILATFGFMGLYWSASPHR